jgi:hypothetical protein
VTRKMIPWMNIICHRWISAATYKSIHLLQRNSKIDFFRWRHLNNKSYKSTNGKRNSILQKEKLSKTLFVRYCQSKQFRIFHIFCIFYKLFGKFTWNKVKSRRYTFFSSYTSGHFTEKSCIEDISWNWV